MAQLQSRLTLLDLPVEVQLKIWKSVIQESQPEELNVCNHANGSTDPVRQLDRIEKHYLCRARCVCGENAS